MGFLPSFLIKSLSLLGSRVADITIRRNLAPVPKHCTVLRLARPSKDYQEKGAILAVQITGLAEEFILSTDDKESVPPHLSVWVESLTTPQQAYEFLQANSPDSPRKLVLRLNVSQICKIVGCSGEGRVHPKLLHTIWVHIFTDNDRKVRDRRSGAAGHSGICGLDETDTPEGLSKKQMKLLRKDLRSKLAELASQSSHEFLSN